MIKIVRNISIAFAVVLNLSVLPLYGAEPNKALNEGIALFNKGKYMEALGLFNQAKSTNSDNPMLHYYMASALMKLNQKEDAIREYKMTLLLDPNGRLASYCQTALQSLGAAEAPAPKAAPPAKATGKAGVPPKGAAALRGGKRPGESNSAGWNPEPPVKVSTPQTPQVISVLCGCPLCHRLDLILTDLNTKHGDNVEFTRTMMSAGDDKTKELIKKFSINRCPTVLLIGTDGQPAREFTGVIPERDLHEHIGELAKMSPKTRLTSVEDKYFAEQRKMVVSEVDSRVAHDQIRVDHTIKQIQQEADDDIAALLLTRDVDREAKRELIKNDMERRTKSVRDDFERRKREWYAAADARIKALQATGGYNKKKEAEPAK